MDGVIPSCGGRHTLIVVDNVPKMVTAAIMSLAHTHRVVCQVHIAVVALQRVSFLVMEIAVEVRNIQKTRRPLAHHFSRGSGDVHLGISKTRGTQSAELNRPAMKSGRTRA